MAHEQPSPLRSVMALNIELHISGNHKVHTYADLAKMQSFFELIFQRFGFRLWWVWHVRLSAHKPAGPVIGP